MTVDHRPPPWSKRLRRALSVLVGVMALICASAQQAAFSQETAPAISGHQREAPSVQHQTPENNKTSLTGKKLLRTIIVDNYYPYTFVNDKGGPDGFSVDLLKAVATILGMEVQIDVDVWEEAREGLNSGEIDFLPMMAYSEERDRYFDFSVPHSISYDAIFTRKKSPGLRSLRNLKDKKIIVMNNDQSHDYLRSLDFISEDNLILINDLKDALRMLASGKGDAALMPKLVGLVFIDQLKLTNLELQPVMIEAYKRPFSIAVKNGNQELLERFNQGLTILKETHRYDEIYEKWFGIVNPIGIPTKDIVRYVLLAVSAITVVGGFVLVWIVVLHRTVRRRTMELGERVKELQCLFAVSEVVGRLELSVDEALQLIANLIPPAWQYPEVTCARIFWGGREYLSRGFLETEWRLAGEVLAENNRVGTVEVYYLEEKPELAEGPFHAEERNLINALSATLGRFIERKRAEEVLRKQALVWEQMSEGVVVLDNDSLILDMNPAAETMFGYSKDEMLGKRPSIWQKEDFVGKTADDIADGIRRDGHWSGETNVVRKDGSHRVFEANAVAAHDENGNLIGRVGVNRDITERKQSELALRESAAHLRSIMDNAPVSIILKDCEGRFLAANQAYLRTLVLAADQVIGKTTYSHNSKEIADEISSQERLVIETRSPRSFEVTRDSPNVGTRALVVVRFPVVTEDGAVIGVGAISFDVTDRNTLERQLVHAQKMEAVGQLTGGLAHDLNNALGIILMNVGMLNGNTDGTPSATECLNGITKGVNRAGKLTRKLLDFSRTDVGETKLVSVNKFVQGMGA